MTRFLSTIIFLLLIVLSVSIYHYWKLGTSLNDCQEKTHSQSLQEQTDTDRINKLIEDNRLLQAKYNNDVNTLHQYYNNREQDLSDQLHAMQTNLEISAKDNAANLKSSVLYNGFYFLFGYFPDDKNKSKVQQKIFQEFEARLNRMCVIKLLMFSGQGNNQLKQESDWLSERLDMMNARTLQYGYKVPAEFDLMLNNLKKHKPNQPFHCFD